MVQREPRLTQVGQNKKPYEGSEDLEQVLEEMNSSGTERHPVRQGAGGVSTRFL